MAGPFDFTGKNIEDTYQRIVQISGSGFCDGTGSAISIGSELQISSDGDNRILTSNGDGTLTAESSLTLNGGTLVGDFTSFAVRSQGGFNFDDSLVNFGESGQTPEITINGSGGHITASGNISASNNITANGVTAQINITPEYASDSQAHELIFGNVPNGGGFTTLKAEQHPSITRRLSYTPDIGTLDVYNLNVNNKIKISGSVVVETAVGETQIGNTSDNKTLIQSPRLEASNLRITNQITASSNISSSENIYAKRFIADGIGDIGTYFAPKANPSFTGDITVSGDITASNISASGNVLAEDYLFPNSGGALKTQNNAESIIISDDNIDIGFGGTPNWALELRRSEGVVLYDNAQLGGGNTDFCRDLRVEGIGDTHLLFITGGDARIGIGTSTPNEKLTVEGNISASGELIGIIDGGTF